MTRSRAAAPLAVCATMALLVLSPRGAHGATPVQPSAPTALPSERAVPGGIKIIEFDAPADPIPRVLSEGHRVLVLRRNDRWLAIVGIPLSAPLGAASVTVDSNPPRRIGFRIGEQHYATQSLRVAPRQVDLSPGDLARVTRERERIDSALAHWSDGAPATLSLVAPIAGRRSSSFGSRRIFNGAARNPHTGMDIAAPAGTPIRAPLAGEVIATGDYFFNGNTVIVDHGRGFLSMYCHLTRVDVRAGDEISAGARLGTVGATGRATGPHLHWGLVLNGAWVDPALFLAGDRAAETSRADP